MIGQVSYIVYNVSLAIDVAHIDSQEQAVKHAILLKKKHGCEYAIVISTETETGTDESDPIFPEQF